MRAFVIGCACFMVGANGRMLRSQLKSSKDFQGVPHVKHDVQGDVYFGISDTTESTEESTIQIITERMAKKLLIQVPNILDGLETSEEIGGTGTVFCGNELRLNEDEANEIDFYGQESLAIEPRQQSLGLAKYDGVHAQSINAAKVGIDKAQCGRNNCVAGSLVASLAQAIRSQGYHVKHSDICLARGGPGVASVKTCNIMPVFGSMHGPLPQYQRAFSCPDKAGTSMQWEYDKDCNTHFDSNQCEAIPNAHRNKAKDKFLEKQGCTWNWVNDIGIDPDFYYTGICPDNQGKYWLTDQMRF